MEKQKKAKVYLVGAGPGNKGLITVRGLELVRTADIIVYDRLGTAEFLSEAKDGCELIDAGKTPGGHKMTQDEINEVLYKKAAPDKILVRLKGGDPLVFGRGGEESLYLAERGVESEIVSGITSAIAVPAFAGIPVTHRSINTSFAAVTGHEAEKPETATDYAALAKLDSLVFLMGVKNLSEICENLIANGKSPDTPVAVIEHGTTPQQRTLVSTLAEMPALASKNDVRPPAITVVGETVRLRKSLAWFEKSPLFGKKILVTRMRNQAGKLSKKLMELGAEVCECPLIKIVSKMSALDILKEKNAIIEASFLIFTSSNGVELFFEALLEAGFDGRFLSGKQILAIGPATAESMRKYGIIADYVPDSYVAESLLPYFEKIKPAKVLIARAEQARNVLPEKLAEMGHQVRIINAYKTEPESSYLKENVAEIRAGAFDLATLTSSSIADSLADFLEREHLDPDLLPVISIGPITSERARQRGLKLLGEANVFTVDGLSEMIVQTLRRSEPE